MSNLQQNYINRLNSLVKIIDRQLSLIRPHEQIEGSKEDPIIEEI